MRTIVLTEEEHRRLSSFLQNALSRTSWLGSKVREDETDKMLASLYFIKHKLQEVKRDA